VFIYGKTYEHTDLQTDMAHMQYIYVGLTQACPSKSHTISTNNVLDLLLFFVSTFCLLHKSQD